MYFDLEQRSPAVMLEKIFDVLEAHLEQGGYTPERLSADEIIADMPMTGQGHLRFYGLWRYEMQILNFSWALDITVPKARRDDVHQALQLVNQKLWLGHFDLTDEEGLVLFRYALPLRGTDGVTTEQVSDIVDMALSECQRCYPVVQFVTWSKQQPDEAVTMAYFETMGEA